MTSLCFYLDENISPDVAEQLRRNGIDAVSARSIGALGDSDINHLSRAITMGFVFCTHDTDFLQMHSQNSEHTGIIFSKHDGSTIGGWVRALRQLHGELNAEEMKSQVKYISTL